MPRRKLRRVYDSEAEADILQQERKTEKRMKQEMSRLVSVVYISGLYSVNVPRYIYDLRGKSASRVRRKYDGGTVAQL